MLLINSNEARWAKRRGDAPEAEDIALLSRVAGGDVAAFDALCRRYGPRLRRFIERSIGRPHLIDEILNDTMLVIWRNAASFDVRSKVSTWILGIARHRGLKAVKRQEPVAVFDLDGLRSPVPGPEENFSRSELRAGLEQALKALSAEHRAVVELSFFEDCSYREIATLLHCPIGTVKTRMFHARRRLKELLADRRENAA